MTDDRRIRDARDRLAANGADALICFPSRNLQYLTGHYEEPGERHALLFVPRDGEPTFLVPELAADRLRTATPVEQFRVWRDDENPTDALADVIADLGLAAGHLLVDDTMHARFTQDLRAVAPRATFGLASELLGPLRVRKDETELDALCRAARAADAVVDDLREWGADVIGMTETELARHVADRLATHGGDGVSFETIVGSGPNGAMPHHTHGDREIRPGDPVVLDFGTRVDGYPSDQTRTLVFDGDRFVHRTGHGVGVEVHEEPFVTRGAERELEPGMVFSVEPGIYLPDEFGVRIEDLVVVTEDGCERLNETDRGWACQT